MCFSEFGDLHFNRGGIGENGVDIPMGLHGRKASLVSPVRRMGLYMGDTMCVRPSPQRASH